MGSFKRIGKRVVSGVLCLVMSLTFVASMPKTVAHADSNTRMQVNIEWAQKKGFNELSTEDLSSLTYDDLRMVGVFLSNFYIPFSTTLGEASTDDGADEVREQMVDALVDMCNFDREVAEALVPMIWDMSLSTAKKLVIGEYDAKNHAVKELNGCDTVLTSDLNYNGNVYSDDSSEGDEEDAPAMKSDSTYSTVGVKASYYNFLVAWAGGVNANDHNDFNIRGEMKAKNFCLFWEDDNKNNHIVFDSNNRLIGRDEGSGDEVTNSNGYSSNPSASMISYALLNDTVAYSAGIGSALFGVEDYATYSKLSSDDKDTVFINNSQLYVDTFGNIILDFGGQTYVVVPACCNPYAWYSVSEGTESAGKYLNVVNQYFIAEAEQKNIVYRKITNGIGDACKWRDAVSFNFKGELFSLNYFRKWWGAGDNDKNYKLDTKIIDNNEISVVKDAITNSIVYDEDGSSDNNYANFPAWDNNSSFESQSDSQSASCDIYAGSDVDYGAAQGLLYDMCMIDSVGKLSQITGTSEDTIQSVTLFNNSDVPEITLDRFGQATNDAYICQLLYTGFMPPQFSSIGESNKLTKLSGTSMKVYMVSIYLSYVYAFYDDSEEPKLSWAYNRDAFPSAPEAVDWSNVEISSTVLYDETLSLVNLFLHPTKGIKIVTTWFKNKISGILLGWHEDMVGKAGAASTTGSTKYVGFSGYVTIPNLNDLEWTAFIMDTYDQLVVYFIIVILIILLGYKMIGTLSWQKVVLSGLLFAICAYLPPRLINATVDASNQICNSFYGDKFTYWALVQHEQYASALDSAVASADEWNYLSTVFANQAAESADSYALVTVKWQCPKKENYWADVQDELTETNNSISKFIMPLIRDTIDGETYTEAADNQYLYRSYTDLGTYANSLYENGSMESIRNTGDNPQSEQRANTITFEGLYESNKSKGMSNTKDNSKAKDRWLQAYRNPYFAGSCASLTSGKSPYGTKTATTALQAIRLGFNFDTARATEYMLVGNDTSIAGSTRYNTNRRLTDFSYCGSVNFAWSRGLSDVSGQVGMPSWMPEIYCNRVYGVPLEAYNTTLADVNDRANSFSLSTPQYSKDSDIASLVFANYTESPFMYFSYNLSDQLGAAQKRNEASSYKDLFLLKDGSYFYNMLTVGGTNAGISDVNRVMENGVPASDGYGELRDYMDMRSLFYVVIPYLKSINDVVIDYDNTYGLFMYDGVTLEYDDKNNIILPEELQYKTGSFQTSGQSDTKATGGEDYYKYIHNWEVAQLLNMYTPWVDVMYDCEYAKGENIYVLGEKFYVKNPLDPLSYYEQDARGNIIAGREMVFSRSEMAYYGLSMEDLTQVEQKIITISDNCYEDLLQVIDYYNFQPEVLNTAIAMLETFEFNRQFSETSVFGADHVLYPQNYELKNFSYDAYLRLILAGTTGEDLNNLEDADIYSTVVKNSSILTALLMILLDLFTVYAIPALKLFFVIGIFFMSILMILVATIRLEVKLSKALGESLVFPLLKFFGVTVGMAWIVSLFMYDGNTAVTGRTSRIISLGDPTMAIIVMLVLNIAVLILYWKICKGVFKDCKKYAQAVGTSVGGMFGGAVAMLGAGMGMGMIMGKKGNGSSGSKILPKRKNNGDSDGSGGNGSGSGGGKGNGSSGVTAGASGGGNGSGGGTPAFNADGTANRMDKNGNFVKPKKNKKTETSAYNKYDDKIDKAKTKAKAKTDRQMDKLTAKEDVNVKRQWLENNLRSHAQYDEHMSDRQRARYNKKADKLKAQREKSTNKINRDFDRLANKEEKRNGKLNTKVDKLQKKSAVRSEKISRDVTNKSFKKAVKESKKKSRVAGKKK